MVRVKFVSSPKALKSSYLKSNVLSDSFLKDNDFLQK
jgi:hypothetical protein